MRNNVTLYLSEPEMRSLQKLAAERGFVQTTGYAAGQAPNVSALVRAIAAGRVVAVGPTPEPQQVYDALGEALKFFRRGGTHDALLQLRAVFQGVGAEAAVGTLGAIAAEDPKK